MHHLANRSRNENIHFCRKACEATPGCSHAFYGRVVQPIELAMMRRAAQTPKYILDAADEPFVCWLYRDCPSHELPFGQMMKLYKPQIYPSPCGQKCDDKFTPCAALKKGWMYEVTLPKDAKRCPECSVGGCFKQCLKSGGRVSWCNGFAFDESTIWQDGLQAVRYQCIIYGPQDFAPVHTRQWTDIEETQGRLGDKFSAGRPTTTCFLRLWPSQADRERSGRHGILMHWSDRPSCGGCWTRSITDFFFKTPSNLASVLTNIVTIVSFLYIARAAQRSYEVGKVVFTGRPMVDMSIVEDAANPSGFEARERAYMHFVQRCFALANVNDEPVDVDDELAGKGVHGSADCAVQEVEAGSLDEYELCNLARTTCYVDRDLLGLLSGERIIHVWSDTARHGWQYMLLSVAYQSAALAFGLYFLPTTQSRHMIFWPVSIAIILRLLYNYSEYRREEQGLCMITNRSRVIQLSRRPPALWFLPWRGGISVRLDTCHIGDIYLAQLDMPTVPLLKDRARAALVRPPWRRGVVAVRTEHGILELMRKHGEVLEVYRALLVLAGSAPREDLASVGEGGAEIDGFCPTRDLLRFGERHIWERKMDAYGFFGDAFNYVSILSITDCRVVVTRARLPKPLTIVGLMMGPLTLGTRCRGLQEFRGTHAYLTVTSISHAGVESYATARTRSPPFWPGFMAPRTSISFTFLARFMHIYPAGLFATQRPYGMPLSVRLQAEVRLRRHGSGLVVVSSLDKAAPRGHVVVEALDRTRRAMSLEDPRWDAPEGAVLGPGCKLTFEAADPEWNTYADEPWLRQLRVVLDHVIGRSKPPEGWLEDLEEPAEPPELGPCVKTFAHLLGPECFGEHFKPKRYWDLDGEEEWVSDSDDSPEEPLISSRT